MPAAVRLSTYPRSDFKFAKTARSHLGDGADTPAALQLALCDDYPMVRVVAGITEAGLRRWYAYRDGRLIV